MAYGYQAGDLNDHGELKVRRFPPAGDDGERRRLEALGYEFRGITASGKHQIMVLQHTPTDPEAVEAIETTFGLERDLQQALRKNIGQLEAGLKIVDHGKERVVESGRIDILGEDSAGNPMIIELKAGTADRDAVAQILGYMGDLISKGEHVRGILVAGDFAPRTLSAAKAVPDLQLRKYKFQFSFEAIS